MLINIKKTFSSSPFLKALKKTESNNVHFSTTDC